MTFEQADFIPSTLSPAAVQTARQYWSQGQYAAAWNALAQAGDRYADNAAGVLGGGSTADQFFNELVRNHWEYTVGEGAYAQKFNDVARDHLKNYLDELGAGYIPSTQDIINSYEDALAKNGVDKSAAFDGAWAKATPGDVADGSWGAFLGMDTDRITTSHTSNGLNEWQAKALVMFDFLRTAQDMGPSGFGAAVGELISRGGTAMVDYFKDTLGAAFDFLISPANGSDPGLSDQIDDLLSRLTPDKNGLNALLSGLEKIFDNQDIEDAKDHLDHAKSVSSPIVLDLDGNGVSTTAVKDGAYFDHAGDGFAERTGWVGTGDGLLVRDLDGNGRIDTGAELFGSETRLADGTKAANGFEALKSLDGNHDGQIDANDPAFASLKIWIDADGDGYSQPGELLTLTQAGVAAIATGYAVSTLVDAQGNAHSQIGTYTRADGGVAAAEDVWFAVDRAYSLATTWADVPTDIAALPDLPGYGTVRDLHQAMALDTGSNLETLVAAYVAEPDEGQRHSLLDAIVYAWTGVDGIDPHSRGGYTDRATPMLGYPAGVH